MRMQETGVAPGRVISGARWAGAIEKSAEPEYKKRIIATWGQKLLQVSQNEGEIS